MAKKVTLCMALKGRDAVKFEEYLANPKTYTLKMQANIDAAIADYLCENR